MVRQVPLLSTLPRVRLPPGPPPHFWLRRPPQDGALSTLEAIGRAMGILEGPELQQAIEELFVLMVKRHQLSRGSLPTRGLEVPGVDEGLG